MPRNPISRLSRLLATLIPAILLAACFGEGDGKQRIPGTPIVDNSGEYVLVFSDEFNGTSLAADKWTIETGYGPNNDGWGNNEWQRYTDSSDNVRVEGGNLVLSAQCPTPPCGVRDGTITSGKINSLDKFNFKFGKIEARIKPPVGDSAWPAFWALGANHPQVGWPLSGEIDFLEVHNAFSNENTAHFTMHWCEDSIQAPMACSFPVGWVFDTQNTELAVSLGDDFHLFEVEWNSERIVGKIDGMTFFTRTIDPVNMAEFLREFYMIFNVAMGGTLGSNNQPPDGNEVFPQTMLVDYVKVYQRESDGGSNSSGGGGGPTLSQIDLPITFDDPTVDYTLADFGEPVPAMTTLVPDPDDSGNTVASTTKSEGTPVWAGTTMSTEEGFASAIPFTDSATTIGIRVYSPDAGIPVRMKAENEVQGAFHVETEVLTTVANEWETLVFDFASEVPGTDPLNVEAEYFLLSVFFNFGTDGTMAGEKTYLWDDVEFGVQPPDTTAPTLTTVNVKSSNNNPAFAAPGDVVTVSLTADEPIMRPTVMIAGASADSVTGGGANYAARRTLTAGDLEGAVTFSVAFVDLAGNAGAPVSMSSDGSGVTLDTTAPTVAIMDAPAMFTTLEPFSVTFQFSEAVSDFALADIQVSGGSKSGLMADGSDTYTANVTPNGIGNLTIDVAAGAARDLAGNPSEMAATVTVGNALDADAPLLSFISIASSNANDTAYARTDDVVTIALTANEDIMEPVVSIGGLPATVNDAGDNAENTWQASRAMLETDMEGEINFVINFQDLGGNAGPQSTVTTNDSSVTFDITAPTLSINGVPEPVETLIPIPVTFQFSEDVSGFEVGDIVVTNGTLSDFASDDNDAATYTANVTPDDSGVPPITLTVSVADNVAIDPAGNDNIGDTASGLLELLPFWREVWSDEFDGMSLNLANWTARTSGDCPDPCNGQQVYSDANVSVADGVLNIVATDSIVRGGPAYTSGLIDTRGNLEFKYGRVEIDARMPAAAGSEPSLWLLPAPAKLPSLAGAYGPWPLSGEIDIVNAPDLDLNNNLQHTLRYGLPEPEDTATTGDTPFTPDDVFHTYALEWEAGEIRWFVDDVHVVTQKQDSWYAYYPDADGVYTLGTDPAPFDQDFYLLMSLAVGDNVGGGAFSQQLEIEAVRVYNCAYGDPVDGTGCSTGMGIAPTVAPYTAPYTEMLDVYIDAPATLVFEDASGTTTPSQLVTETFTSGAGVTVFSTTDVVEPDDNVVWNVDISASGGTGGVFMRAGDPASYFDLSGGETAGELLFRMRVNVATNDPLLMVGLDSDLGNGATPLEYVVDAQWRQYSVKIADLVTASVMRGSSLNLANLVNLFSVEATGGSVNIDLDNIQVKVACRVDGTCQATPRSVTTEVELYFEDFEALGQADPNALANWLVFANVFDGSNGNYLYGYGTDPGPNGTGAFSNVAAGQGGPDQGAQQLVVFSDYNNRAEQIAGNLIEANFFHECTISSNDVGAVYTFSFDAKLGDLVAPSTALAFIKTLDPGAGFATTNLVTVDTTTLPTSWANFQLSLELTSDLEGQLVQFGFSNTTTNDTPSGIYYDNVSLVTNQANPDPCPE